MNKSNHTVTIPISDYEELMKYIPKDVVPVIVINPKTEELKFAPGVNPNPELVDALIRFISKYNTDFMMGVGLGRM